MQWSRASTSVTTWRHSKAPRTAAYRPPTSCRHSAFFLQNSLALPPGIRPTLVGYSSGATLVYAALVEGGPGRFKGALGLGFCPDLDLKKPLCAGAGLASMPRDDPAGKLKGVNFLPAKRLPAPWVVLQGGLDQVCPAPPTQAFMAAVPGAQLVLLPKVGHGYSVEKNWVPQFEQAFRHIVAAGSSTSSADQANRPHP